MQKQISSVIIDDEPGNIVTLQEMLKVYCPWVYVDGTAADPVEGYEVIRNVDPDLVFLDIEMPYGNAFDMLDKIAPVTFEVIFVTAFDNYAVKAFKYAAIDYILKPVSITELQAAVQKVTNRQEEKKINTRITALLANLKGGQVHPPKIGLATIDGFRFEDINSILYLKAEGSYTIITIRGKIVEMVSKHLKEFEDVLPDSIFCRVHHSFIVNINFVKKYYKGRGGYVEMEDGTKIEIATRKKDDFLKRFVH